MMSDEAALREMVRDAVRRALSEANLTAATENSQSPSTYYAPWTGVEYEAHPSRRQFSVGEAAVNIGELLEFAETRQCSIEQDKLCDHCGMCRNLGF